MEKFVRVALVLLFAAICAAQLSDELRGELEACKTKFNVTEEDIKSISEKQPPTSKEAKCYLHCIFWKMDVMTEDGKMNPEGMKTFIKQIPDMKDTDLEKLNNIADNCGKTPLVEEVCENAVVIFNCVNAEAEEMGLKGP